MADEAEEVNTVAEDGVETQRNELEASTHDTDGDLEGHHEPDRTEEFSAPAENSWSAPLLSLARRATESLSSGVNYASSQRNSSQGSAVSSPAENERENDVGSSSKLLPGQCCVLGRLSHFNLNLTAGSQPHGVCQSLLPLGLLSAVRAHDPRDKTISCTKLTHCSENTLHFKCTLDKPC